MSCCGESKDSSTSNQHLFSQTPDHPVTIQPSAVPSISPFPLNGSPSPVHQGSFHDPRQPAVPLSPPPATYSSSPPSAQHTYQPIQQHPAYGHHQSPSIYNVSEFGASIQPPPSAYQQQTNRVYDSVPGQSVSDQAESAEDRLSVAIDFGTTFSGVAYASSRIHSGRVQTILNWPGSTETFRKIPTCLLYSLPDPLNPTSSSPQVMAWGLEAKNTPLLEHTLKCEWFKLFLEPAALRDGVYDPRLPALPPGKAPLDLITDFLSCLWEYAASRITQEIGLVADLNTAYIHLTIPAAWDLKGTELMKRAAIDAGLVSSAHSGDTKWRERLRIITEPEAAAVHCAFEGRGMTSLKPSQNFLVCDAGGGTVDLAVYKILASSQNNSSLSIAEIAARSGGNCGSLFLDLRFRELVKALLADHPLHSDPASLAYFMHSFSESDKLSYEGVKDDDTHFNFTCFHVEDPHDPSVGLVNGELTVPGKLLRREVFDPIINEAISLISAQIAAARPHLIDAILLVGGFAGSHYLKARIEEEFSLDIPLIIRPPDADTATLRGAARYGLEKRALVSSIIVPKGYLMKVKLPVEPEDYQKRPAYIRNNDAGYPICENRLQYLVQKGAILRKGQRIATKFCKYSPHPSDSNFVAVLYTSDSDHVMRYTDEGQIHELCKWTVDLGGLPAFRDGVDSFNRGGGGFYTEFEIGLELDSAEVRGLLLYNGEEWGRVVFDFLQ